METHPIINKHIKKNKHLRYTEEGMDEFEMVQSNLNVKDLTMEYQDKQDAILFEGNGDHETENQEYDFEEEKDEQ